MKKSYQRNADTALHFVQDQLTSNSKFDRAYTYDHLGRVVTALSGAEARGEGATNDRPYKETFSYDAMDHLTVREINQWDRYDSTSDSYLNNRTLGWQYDADDTKFARDLGRVK